MANSRSARKRIRASERKHIRNRAVRSSVRTHVAKARQVVLSAEGLDVEATLKAAVSALDRAAEKGIIHRNNARRRKSRLTAMAAKIMRATGDEQIAARNIAAGGQKGTGARAKGKVSAKKPASVKATAGKAPAPKAAAKRAVPVKAAAPEAPSQA